MVWTETVLKYYKVPPLGDKKVTNFTETEVSYLHRQIHNKITPEGEISDKA